MMSGGRAEKFRAGWALPIGTFGKAHYFVREGAGLVKSLCGSMSGAAGGLFEAGQWPKCARCTSKAKLSGL